MTKIRRNALKIMISKIPKKVSWIIVVDVELVEGAVVVKAVAVVAEVCAWLAAARMNSFVLSE